MVEPSMSSESLELPSSSDDLPFELTNPLQSSLLDENLLIDSMDKQDSLPTMTGWLAVPPVEGFVIPEDQLIAVSHGLIGGVRDEMMASSRSTATQLDDDIDMDSKSVFTVHEIGGSSGNDVIGSNDFDLDDSLIHEGVKVDPSLVTKPFVEQVDSQSNVSSFLSDSGTESSPQTAASGKQTTATRCEAETADSAGCARLSAADLDTTKQASGGRLISPSVSNGSKAASNSAGGSQPRRSVRISEHDPRDFVQELRQGHYLKPRMPASPVKAAAASAKKATPRAGSADGASKSAKEQQSQPRSGASVKLETSRAEGACPEALKRKCKDSVSGEDHGAQGPARKMVASERGIDDASSSDDPDSVPLMHIKQKLVGANSKDDPDSIPLVHIKQKLIGAQNGVDGSVKEAKEQTKSIKKVSFVQPKKELGTLAGTGVLDGQRLPMVSLLSLPNRDCSVAEMQRSSSIAKPGGSLKKNLQQMSLPCPAGAPAGSSPKGSPAMTGAVAKVSQAAGASKKSAKTSLLSGTGSGASAGDAQGSSPAAAAAGHSKVTAGKAESKSTSSELAKTEPKTGRSGAGSSGPASAALPAHTGTPLASKRKLSADDAGCKSGPQASKVAKPTPKGAAFPGRGAAGAQGYIVKKQAAPEKLQLKGSAGVKLTAGDKRQPKDSGSAKSTVGDKGQGGERLSSVPQLTGGEVVNVGPSTSGRRLEKTTRVSTAPNADQRRKSCEEGDVLEGSDLTFVDEVEEDDSDWNEENDPDRLWCVCRKPHDNRFMICCDRCQEWYHGDCVGISRARGSELETNGEEYICVACKEVEIVNRLRLSSDATRDERMKERETKERTDQSLAKGPKQDSTKPPPEGGGSFHVGEIRKRAARGGADSQDSQGASSSGGIKKRIFKQFKSLPPMQGCIAAGCERPALAGGVYCGPNCVRRYVIDMLRLIDSQPEAFQQMKANLAKRAKTSEAPPNVVVLVEQHSGKIILGSQAPDRSALADFLLKHKSYEVLQPGQRVVKSLQGAAEPSKFYAKGSASKSPKESSGAAKTERKSSSPSTSKTSRQNSSSSSGGVSGTAAELSKAETDVTRAKTRKSLTGYLMARVEQATDISVPASNVEAVAVAIENELFQLERSVSKKYRNRYRSLLFNIRDPMNKGLFRKIVKNRIKPYKLVRMAPEELASSELTQWRELEMKHELDRIKEVEELRSREVVPRILTISHKQEMELLNEDLSSLRQVVLEEKPKDMNLDVTSKNVELFDAAADKESKLAVAAATIPAATTIDTTNQHGSHTFDISCRICSGQQAPQSVAAEAASAATKKPPRVERHVHLAKDEPRRHAKVQLSAQPPDVVDRVVAREMRHLSRELEDMKRTDAELMQRATESSAARSPPAEPTSTVESPRPHAEPYVAGVVTEKVMAAPAHRSSNPPVWKGSLQSPEINKFFMAAHALVGPIENVKSDIPDVLNIGGTIRSQPVWTYLSQLKHSSSRDVVLLSLSPLTDDEQSGYIEYCNQLLAGNRCGVVKNACQTFKDMYIVPLSTGGVMPPELLQCCRNSKPGQLDLKSHVRLIAVIVLLKNRKQPLPAEPQTARAKKPHPSEHKKVGLMPPVESEPYSEPYDPEKAILPYRHKAVLSTGLASSTTTDPIVRAFAHADVGRLSALDTRGASPYSPSQSDEAYDPGDEVQIPLSGYDSLKTTAKKGEAEQAKADSKAQTLGTAAAVVADIDTSLLLAVATQAGLTAGNAPLPKALQDILGGSAFAAASGGSSGAAYSRQTAPAGTAPASFAVADPRLASRSAVPVDPRIASRATDAAGTAVTSYVTLYNYQTVPAATSASHPSQASVMPTAVLAPAVAPTQSYYTSALLPAQASNPVSGILQHSSDVVIPGLGDGVDWPSSAGDTHGGHSPYLLDERDYDERQPLSLHYAANAAAPSQPRTVQPLITQEQEPQSYEEFQDFDYRSLPPQAERRSNAGDDRAAGEGHRYGGAEGRRRTQRSPLLLRREDGKQHWQEDRDERWQGGNEPPHRWRGDRAPPQRWQHNEPQWQGRRQWRGDSGPRRPSQ